MKYPKRNHYKYATSRYRIRNWPEYEAGPRNRGDLTIWLSDAALDARQAPASGRPGGQPTSSDLAVEAALTIRIVPGFTSATVESRRKGGFGGSSAWRSMPKPARSWLPS
jgi:hypothetical protein